MLLDKLNDVDSSSSNFEFDLEQFRKLEKLQNRINDTNASQSFSSRFSEVLSRFYNKFDYFTSTQQLVLFGILLSALFTSRSNETQYRIDKSPSATSAYNIRDWNNFFDSEKDYFTELDDQPRYSYDQAYLLAKKLGLKTEYEL